jgi:hypothetical protein
MTWQPSYFNLPLTKPASDNTASSPIHCKTFAPEIVVAFNESGTYDVNF